MTYLAADLQAEVMPHLMAVRASAEWQELYGDLVQFHNGMLDGHDPDSDLGERIAAKMHALDLTAYAAAGRAREAAVRAWRYLPS